jgi:predicted RNase H-like HicB family nuclease
MPFIIHRKPPYRVYIEQGPGGAMAHVAELPGCFAVGRDASRAAGAVPAAIAGFLTWLRGHREPLVPEASVSRPSLADLYVAEVRSEGAPTVAGSRAELFEFDKTTWDDEKLERSLRWLGYSRADLLAKIEGLSEADLKARRVQPDRSVWDTLWHVANAEFGYVRRIAGPLEGVEPVTDNQPSDLRERLAVIREVFERRVRAVPPGKRAEVIYPTWANRPDEPWTLPKAVRRAIEHEREHLAEL